MSEDEFYRGDYVYVTLWSGHSRRCLIENVFENGSEPSATVHFDPLHRGEPERVYVYPLQLLIAEPITDRLARLT